MMVKKQTNAVILNHPSYLLFLKYANKPARRVHMAKISFCVGLIYRASYLIFEIMVIRSFLSCLLSVFCLTRKCVTFHILDPLLC